MVKFTYTNRFGTPSYGFGLSETNIRKLKEGKPIVIDLTEMGATGEVFIFYGATEQAMGREMAEFIGPNTKVYVDPRRAD